MGGYDAVDEEVLELPYRLQFGPQALIQLPKDVFVLPGQECICCVSRPCLRAFRRTAAFPSGVFGPVLLRALRRFASAFLALVMCSFLSSAKTPSGRLYSRRSHFQGAKRWADQGPV